MSPHVNPMEHDRHDLRLGRYVLYSEALQPSAADPEARRPIDRQAALSAAASERGASGGARE